MLETLVPEYVLSYGYLVEIEVVFERKFPLLGYYCLSSS